MDARILLPLVTSLVIGTAHAAGADTSPGFDRVGHAAAVPASVHAAAPGETRRAKHEVSPERQREMARRLVWLMLSAR